VRIEKRLVSGLWMESEREQRSQPFGAVNSQSLEALGQVEIFPGPFNCHSGWRVRWPICIEGRRLAIPFHRGIDQTLPHIRNFRTIFVSTLKENERKTKTDFHLHPQARHKTTVQAASLLVTFWPCFMKR
jgi:hypothetical protein